MTIRSPHPRRQGAAGPAASPGRALFAAGVAAALLATSPALAQGQAAGAQTPGTTGQLAQLCATPAGDPTHAIATGYCRGVLVGVGQTHALMTTAPDGVRSVFCLPTPSPSLDEAMGAFVRWVAANPQQAATKSANGVLAFAAATYPCATPRR